MAVAESTTSDWNAERTAREVVRCARRGALATTDADGGFPYASLVSVGTSVSGEPLMLLSNLARHTRNIGEGAPASLLLESAGEGDPLAAPRVTLIGTVAADEDPESRRRFLARQPYAKGYAGFADFRIFRLTVESAHLVAGFGRIETLPREAVILPPEEVAAVAGSEGGATEHMNEDHLDAIALYARAFLGEADGDWRLDGFDPEGMELRLGERVRYLPFASRITAAGALRAELVRMAGEARRITGEPAKSH
jgi:heme iron utilization protein